MITETEILQAGILVVDVRGATATAKAKKHSDCNQSPTADMQKIGLYPPKYMRKQLFI